MGLVLNEDGDFSEPGVKAITERKIDDAIFPAEGNRRLRPMLGERIKTLALSACQYHGENILHRGEL